MKRRQLMSHEMPDEFPHDPRFVLARSIILDAAALALSSFADLANLSVEHKQNGQDVVSETDKAVEMLIRTRVAGTFPQDGVLGEEEGLVPGRSGFLWVVDPIDGTSCFVHGLDQWCISIAVMEGETTVIGLIYRPTTNDLFVARQGEGAFLNATPMRVNGQATLSSGLLGVGANFRVPHRQVSAFIDLLLQNGGMFIRNGSGALMLAEVASGRLVGYYEPHINAWDCMAGLLMIREAGGWTGPFPTAGDALLKGAPVVGCAPQIREEIASLIRKSLENVDQIA